MTSNDKTKSTSKAKIESIEYINPSEVDNQDLAKSKKSIIPHIIIAIFLIGSLRFSIRLMQAIANVECTDVGCGAAKVGGWIIAVFCYPIGFYMSSALLCLSIITVRKYKDNRGIIFIPLSVLSLLVFLNLNIWFFSFILATRH